MVNKSSIWLLVVSLLVAVLMLAACEHDLTTIPTTSLHTNPTTTIPITTSSPPAAHFPEQWSFSDLTVAPSEADIGEEVLITVWVYVYYVEKPATAYLAIDGEVVATKDLYLDTDYTESVSFTVVMEEEGTHEVRCAVLLQEEEPYEVGVNDLVASLTIRPIPK